MTDDQLSILWAFARGDLSGETFEQWCFEQPELEDFLGNELHWEVVSADYANKEIVWHLRQTLADCLRALSKCECLALRDLAVVPMGGDLYQEKVFNSLDNIFVYGKDKWWLYVVECRVCLTNWLVAQDERIYDNFYLRRMNLAARQQIADTGDWPDEFITYESVLRLGRTLSNPCTFFDPHSPALVHTKADLRKERSDIIIEEIAYLLAIPVLQANSL
ncbi:hypothetical protein [Novosphingobium sp.]|uniref:hypothetical protein n=1 Tax=Novosphingobium sp. TaxID=1874826 RepID=UPI003B522E7F